MERTLRLVGIVVRGTQWGLPWIGVLALSASLASAMTLAVAGAPAREPKASISIAPTVATAGLADGDDVQASPLTRVSVRDGGPIQLARSETSESCDSTGGRLLYVGVNSWIPAESKVAPCSFGAP